MPHQRREDRTEREALAARAHDLRTLLAGARPGEGTLAHYQAELLQIEKLLPILTDQPTSTETRGGQDEDLLTVRAAAQRVGVPANRVHTWIRRGKLTVQPRDSGARLVSLAAVQALADATALSPGREGYVPPYVAARDAGVPHHTVREWGRTGKVATLPGPYGQLVRLADVLARAAQAPIGRDTDGLAGGDA